MPQRALWASALVAAALADAVNEPRLGLYLVFAGVVAGAAVALRTVAELVDEDGGPLVAARVVLAAGALLALVAAASLRAPYTTEGVVPQASATALWAALGLIALDALLAPLRRPEPAAAVLER